jgi:hypothetical protein
VCGHGEVKKLGVRSGDLFDMVFFLGRACAIAADKKSFDLCDDSEGLGVGHVLNDPENMALFGYGPLVDGPAASEAKEGPGPENGSAESTNGLTKKGEEEVPIAVQPVDEAPVAIPQ